MSGTILSSSDLDPRRRRILFRSWHRGMREMDLLIGQFADAHLRTFSESELDEFEALIEYPDRELLSWLTGSAPVAADVSRSLFDRLKAFHAHTKPINV
ncbi:MAG: succinate dehydrogenase assembly factor 2 [Betaproteobacteria bacterium]|nr:succinate dehydrogenase assembly factor 2 [Betaproteobacteria bacterium]